MPPRRLSPNSVWDQAAVLAAFEEAGVKPMHAMRMWGFMIRHPEADWHDVKDMPKAAVEVLDRYFTKFTTTVTDIKKSSDGGTTKLLIQLQDGMQIESVIMTYAQTIERFPGQEQFAQEEEAAPSCSSDPGASAPGATTLVRKRSTLCVSSQVGCQMGCTFCATGTMGLKGNLTAGEIVEQLVHARALADIQNIVYMGMGEPLNNYEAVKSAVNMMTHNQLFSLKKRKVTISTVGVIPRIKQLPTDLPGVSLALSLHAPTQEKRLRIVPSARAYPLPKLIDACREYQAASGQRIFMEYVMLAGVNDGMEEAHELGALLQGQDVWMNVIPWNPVVAGSEAPAFEAPGDERVQAFSDVLRNTYNIYCSTRQEKGQDIAGACGQLVIDAAAAAAGAGRSCSRQQADIEDAAARAKAVAA